MESQKEISAKILRLHNRKSELEQLFFALQYTNDTERMNKLKDELEEVSEELIKLLQI